MKHKGIKLLPWALLAASFLLVIGVYALSGRHMMDSDVAAEMILADLLNEERALMTANWYYSTELRVVSHVPVYQLALTLFPNNWHMARILSLALLMALVAAATIYMGKCAGCKRASIYAAAALLLPVSEVHRFLFSGSGLYAVYVSMTFLFIGMVLRLREGKHRALRLTRLALLALLCGLAGVRMPMSCGVPLCLAFAWDGWDALRAAKSLRGVLDDERAFPALGAALSLVMMLAGYAINSRVLSGIYHFASFDAMEMEGLNLAHLGTQIEYLAGFFGLNTGMPLLSLGGIVDLLSLCVFALMIIAIFVLIKSRAALDQGTRILAQFGLFAVLFGMFINLATGTVHNPYAVGYYMQGAFMLVVLVFLLLERMTCRLEGLRTLSMLAVAGVFFLQGAAFSRNLIAGGETEHEAAAAWLTQNGYTQGFASYWNGNVLTELSDGALDVYVYGEFSEPELTPWLQEVRHLNEAPEGRVFVFVSGTEAYGAPAPVMREENLVWVSPHGSRVYEYADAQEVLALQRTLHGAQHMGE